MKYRDREPTYTLLVFPWCTVVEFAAPRSTRLTVPLHDFILPV
jgi:hypothetical protein